MKLLLKFRSLVSLMSPIAYLLVSVVEVTGGGSDTNGATKSIFTELHAIFLKVFFHQPVSLGMVELNLVTW